MAEGRSLFKSLLRNASSEPAIRGRIVHSV